jgi:hypothetical protein
MNLTLPPTSVTFRVGGAQSRNTILNDRNRVLEPHIPCLWPRKVCFFGSSLEPFHDRERESYQENQA